MSSSSDSERDEHPGVVAPAAPRIPWRARELKRRILNRRRAKDFGDEKQLQARLSEKKKKQAAEATNLANNANVKAALLESRGLQMDIIDQQFRRKRMDERTEYHFRIIKGIRSLGATLRSTNKRIRSKQTSLEHTQRRIKLLTEEVQQDIDRDVDEIKPLRTTAEILDQELRYWSAKLRNYSECKVCGKRLQVQLHRQHEASCKGKSFEECQRMLRRDPSFKKIFEKMQQCGICNYFLLPSQFEIHCRECQHRKDLAATLGKLEIEAPSGWKRTVPPDPPTNVRILDENIKSNSFLLEWDPPVFTGGARVYDYEVAYSLVSRRSSCGKDQLVFSRCPPLKTSRWVYQVDPVRTQVVVPYLKGGTEYGRIFVRARTASGYSRPSLEIELIKTKDIQPTSPPLFVHAGLITEKTILLHWTEPFYIGGGEIEQYEIRFRGQAPVTTSQNANDDSVDLRVTEEKMYVVKTGSRETSFTLTELHGGTMYFDMRVYAINHLGMYSLESERLEVVETCLPGQESKLLQELYLAVNCTSKTIDSSFYNNFAQRYDRKYFIKLLSQTIKETHPEMADQVDELMPEDSSSSSSSSDSDSDTSSSSSSGSSSSSEDSSDAEESVEDPKEFSKEEQAVVEENELERKLKLRRQQYHYRIITLERQIEDSKYNIQWCKDRRAEIIGMIQTAEARLQEKQSEHERARLFQGKSMDSMVLHGRLQHFDTQALVSTLEDEVDIERFYIAESKKDMIQVEKYLKQDILQLARREQLLEDRRTALDEFEKEAIQAAKGRRCLQRLQQAALCNVFIQWQAFVREIRDQRALMFRIFDRLDQLQLRSGFEKWKVVYQQQERSASCPEGMIGIGGKALATANQHRNQLERELHDELGKLRSTHAALKHAAKTRRQQVQAQQSIYFKKEKSERDFFNDPQFKYWRQGDANLQLGKYDQAIAAYEAQLQRLPSSALEEQGRLYAQIGRAMMNCQDYDHAVIKFRRASLLADRLSDRIGEAAAYHGLGDVYQRLRSVSKSIEAYERSLMAYEDLGDSQGQVATLRGLERSYAILEDTFNAKLYKHQADEIEHETRKKLENIDSRLTKMREQLLSVALKPKKTLLLERVNAIVPRLRSERLACKLKIVECEKAQEAFTTLMLEKQELLNEGEDDLKKALASDSAMVDSRIITGGNARYKVADFQQKLGKLMGQLQVAQERIEMEQANAQVRVGNLQDEIEELELELESETGKLMRQVLSKKEIRCFAFNKLNQRFLDVLGKESGGVSTCLASVEDSLMLYDTLTGVCMAHAVGEKDRPVRNFDDRRGHRKVICSMFSTGERLYTGGMDGALGIWHVSTDALELVKFLEEDFDAAVVCISADVDRIVTGCSDCRMLLHDAHTFECLVRVISAHFRTVTCVHLDLNEVVTGGADKEIRIWHIQAPETKPADESEYVVPDTPDPAAKTQHAYSRTAYSIRKKYILKAKRDGDRYFDGHLAPLTCLQFEGTELVSADRNGVIIIWDLRTRSPLRICQVHEGAVLCLQFDTSRIVSGGVDGSVNVTDIATGHILQRLQGHTGRILALQFDQQQLLTTSTDGSMRQWCFESRNESAQKQRFHILGPGETLKSLSLRYQVSTRELLEWNRIRDVKSLYIGQRMLVGFSKATLEEDSLETKVSAKFGKLILEDTKFMLDQKLASTDKEAQKEMKRKQALAREYFPPLLEEEDDESEQLNEESDEDDDLEIEDLSGSEEDSGSEKDENENDGEDNEDDEDEAEEDDDDHD